jgi:hypothetical protein
MKIFAIALAILFVTGLAAQAATKTTPLAFRNTNQQVVCLAQNLSTTVISVLIKVKDGTNSQTLKSSNVLLAPGYSYNTAYTFSDPQMVYCTITTDSSYVRGYLWIFDNSAFTARVILEAH